MGISRLELTGGDPLLLDRNLILAAVEEGADAGMHVALLTNGQHLTREYAEALKAAGLGRMETSLYGASGDVHDWFTGCSGSYGRTLDGIEAARGARLPLVVSTVVTRRNLEDVLSLPELLQPLGVDGIQLSCPVPSGRSRRSMQPHLLTEQEMTDAIEAVEAAFDPIPYLFLNSLFPEPQLTLERYCHYFVEKLVVDHRGDIIPCCLMPGELRQVLGNITSDALSHICSQTNAAQKPVFAWLSKGHEAMREALAYRRRSHNLCVLCIEMLSKLCAPAADPGDAR